MTSETVPLGDLPEFLPLGSGGKKKYPWMTMEPGDGFRFDANVSLTGARSQVANASRMIPPDGVPRSFIVRLDTSHTIWCIRIDNLPLEVRERWRKKTATPLTSTPIGDDQFGQMRETGPHLVGAPGDEAYVMPDELPI